MDIKVIPGKVETCTITLRGEPKALIHTLINGLPTSTLVELREAFGQALERLFSEEK